MNPADNNRYTFTDVVILGGGVTGMQTAAALRDLGIPSVLIEKESELGGRVKNYDKTFPFFHSGKEIIRELSGKIKNTGLIDIRCNTAVERISGKSPEILLKIGGNSPDIISKALVLATGFEPFDASLQEEYGYGVYPNVITGTELEQILDPDGPTGGELKRPGDGKTVKNIAIVFCVGSRSEKLGNNYCSRVCCSYSTKQAIEIKERYPEASVTCFYIDIRTYGRGFEEMYRRAQEMGVIYVRGRVAECGSLPDGDITIRAENTFLGKPVQGHFNLVSLSHGMTPPADTDRLAGMMGISIADDGFFNCKDTDLYPNDASAEGIFLAGAATGLKPVPDCITDGNAVAARIAAYLAGMEVK